MYAESLTTKPLSPPMPYQWTQLWWRGVPRPERARVSWWIWRRPSPGSRYTCRWCPPWQTPSDSQPGACTGRDSQTQETVLCRFLCQHLTEFYLFCILQSLLRHSHWNKKEACHQLFTLISHKGCDVADCLCDIAKWLQDITKWLQDITKWLQDITKWLQDITKWLQDTYKQVINKQKFNETTNFLRYVIP